MATRSRRCKAADDFVSGIGIRIGWVVMVMSHPVFLKVLKPVKFRPLVGPIREDNRASTPGLPTANQSGNPAANVVSVLPSSPGSRSVGTHAASPAESAAGRDRIPTGA